jgi:hypothetical protein
MQIRGRAATLVSDDAVGWGATTMIRDALRKTLLSGPRMRQARSFCGLAMSTSRST